MDKSEISNHVSVMRRQEETAYISTNYLAHRPIQNERHYSTAYIVDEECRAKMVLWCTKIVDFCNFERETVSIALSFLDRFLSTKAGEQFLYNRHEFQLATLGCFFTAIKLSESRELSLHLFSQITNGMYSVERLAKMELQILSALNWRMHPPTPLRFIHELLALPHEFTSQMESLLNDNFLGVVKYQAELSTLDYFFVTQKPSMIAVAAILNALEYFNFPPDDAFIIDITTIAGVEVASIMMESLRARLKILANEGMQAHLDVHSIGYKLERKKRTRSPVSVCR